MNQRKIGEFIKLLRTENKYTQEELAELIPIGREAISKWERGITLPDATNILRLTEIFNISTDELFAGERKNSKNIKEIEKAVLKIYDERNKIKKKLNFSILILLIIIICFLTYYFLTYFNSVKIYTVNCEGDSFTFNNGIMVVTNEKSFFRLGVFNNYSENEPINYKLYYIDENEKNYVIGETSDLSLLYFDEFNGYKENVDFKKLDHIFNNLYIEVSYQDYTEVGHLVLRKNYSNNHFFVEIRHHI